MKGGTGGRLRRIDWYFEGIIKYGLVKLRGVLSLQSHDYSTGEQLCALLS